MADRQEEPAMTDKRKGFGLEDLIHDGCTAAELVARANANWERKQAEEKARREAEEERWREYQKRELQRQAERRRVAEMNKPALEIDEPKRDGFAESLFEGLVRCESPIERLLLPALMAYWPTVCSPEDMDILRLPNCDRRIGIFPQYPFGRYRVDFAIATRVRFRGLTKIVFVVAECDGRAFHDREKDTVRDGELKDGSLPHLEGRSSSRRVDCG
jgi:hypothetical protein